MKLSKIKIRNYRLLVKTDLDVNEETTLIVGRNNTAKTSLFECICCVLEGTSFSYNDYSLSKRNELCSKICDYIFKKITFKDLYTDVEPISVDFFVDYSLENEEDDLGALAPFIIDIDDETTTALIRVEFILKQEKIFLDSLKRGYYKDKEFSSNNDVYLAIEANFSELFEFKIYAVNPNNANDKQIKKQAELKELFPFFLIPAERLLGEDGTQNSSLSKLISEFFSISDDELEQNISAKIKELRIIIDETSKNLQQNSNEILSTLVNNAVGFGYPNEEELKLSVKTQLSIDEQIKNKTQLSYVTETDEEGLPCKYNGLGYKNLIKMEFLLADYANKLKKYKACIPILFIEEPESHMHPQMQRTFADYFGRFIGKINSVKIQTFITSHSPHIANTIDFSAIRYAQKMHNKVIYKNLNEFAKKNRENLDFIKKYLNLTKCDLFFADKAILVEGASERLLLPDMIEKCDSKFNLFKSRCKLPMQYYTLIEIGGAYAYKFIPFIDFLGIPCLILTDLDSVSNDVDEKSGGKHYKSVPVSLGKTTSNETIKWWFREKIERNVNHKNLIEINKIISMDDGNKTSGNCHIEFQTKENGLCGRSLEEAIKNVNRSHYKLDDNIKEDDLKFNEKSKTDFALDLICGDYDYNIPAYIRSGLKWLDEKKLFE